MFKSFIFSLLFVDGFLKIIICGSVCSLNLTFKIKYEVRLLGKACVIFKSFEEQVCSLMIYNTGAFLTYLLKMVIKMVQVEQSILKDGS